MIISLAMSGAILAQAGYSDMGRRFREGGGSDPITFALFIGALVSILVVALVFARVSAVRNSPGYNSPRHLFRELCRAHKLDWTSRRLLRRFAQHHGLDNPGRLFLEPLHFEPHQLRGALEIYREPLTALRGRIFATASDVEPASE